MRQRDRMCACKLRPGAEHQGCGKAKVILGESTTLVADQDEAADVVTDRLLAVDGELTVTRPDPSPELLDELPAELLETEPNLAQQMQAMVGYMASRTAFFDAFFLDATTAGIQQAVILAAGLDSRSWRLPWPARQVSCSSPPPRSPIC